MSHHDTEIAANAAATETDTAGVGLDNLEALAGLVSDMTNAAITRSAANIEQAIKDRLGPQATIADANRLIAAFREIDADYASDAARH